MDPVDTSPDHLSFWQPANRVECTLPICLAATHDRGPMITGCDFVSDYILDGCNIASLGDGNSGPARRRRTPVIRVSESGYKELRK